MNNIEKYNKAFVDVFGIDVNILSDTYNKNTVSEWDSVHQLGLVAALEEAFDLMFDPEDIMAMTGYAEGKEVLRKYEIEL